jgi:hypothetical protein
MTREQTEVTRGASGSSPPEVFQRQELALEVLRHHESGHAVMAVLQHIGLAGVSTHPVPRPDFGPGMYSLGRVVPLQKTRLTSRDREAAILFDMAGPVAACLWREEAPAPHPGEVAGGAIPRAWTTDFQNVHAHALGLPFERNFFERRWHRAAELLRLAWPAVEYVAEELAFDADLPGTVLPRLVRDALGNGLYAELRSRVRKGLPRSGERVEDGMASTEAR